MRWKESRVADILTEEQVANAIQEVDAVRRGHFVLTSGRHSDTYVQCARILEDPRLTTSLAKTAVHRLPDGLDIDLVAAPAVGGLIIGFAVAQALDVRFIFSERADGRMVFRRAFEVNPGQRVLVVEDVVTTGGSVAEVIELVESAGAVVVGVVSLIDRGGAKAFTSAYWPVLRLEVDSWHADDCGLCASGVAFDSPGSRRLG
jgi:orotate phosphoribosyltransferase